MVVDQSDRTRSLFAAALAKEKRTELITGDPEFKALGNEIKIGWLQESRERKNCRTTKEPVSEA